MKGSYSLPFFLVSLPSCPSVTHAFMSTSTRAPDAAAFINVNGYAQAYRSNTLLGATATSSVSYDKMSIKDLKELVRGTKPAKGVMSTLKKKQDYIDHLMGTSSSTETTSTLLPPTKKSNGSIQWTTAKGAQTFALSLDQNVLSTEPFDKISLTFPGAFTNQHLCDMITSTLARVSGFTKEKTLVATSLCCDEVNRPLETTLQSVYGPNFNFGGLAGFPFGGITSFGAMASHIPDGGSCLVVHGPHVGVDSKGTVGTVERKGRVVGGSCCGSAIYASGLVVDAFKNKNQLPGISEDALDSQQSMVNNLLMPFAERLDKAPNTMKDLPFALYESQKDLVKDIVSKGAGGVKGSGKIAVLGGIQINTPEGYSDYFLPLNFDIYNNKGEHLENVLATATQKPFDKVQDLFPGALTNTELMNKVKSTLHAAGYDESKTLVATSLCCDEINRPLESDLSHIYGDYFNMGGLAGFPFGGATSFGAMAAHIPDGGSCLVVYGPHVGVDTKGTAGTVERKGKDEGGACCGSACAASNYVSQVYNKQIPAKTMPNVTDAQQYFVGQLLMPYAAQLEEAENRMVEVPHALYEAQTELITRIVKQSAAGVKDGNIAVLGGIQINTPAGYSDYYMPLSFKLYDNKGNFVEDLWE